MMKKKIIIGIGIILAVCVIVYGGIVYAEYHQVQQGKLPIFANDLGDGTYQGLGYTVEVYYVSNTDMIEEMRMKLFGRQIIATVQCIQLQEENQETVRIENGNIQNENQIDEFIEKVNNRHTASLSILVIEEGKENHIQVEFVQGKDVKETVSEGENTVNIQVPSSDATSEEYQAFYGYYKITVNGEETERHDCIHWAMKRKTKDNIVQVTMEPYLIEVTELPIICEYTLESSAYEKRFELMYEGRKDMGVKRVAEMNQFDNTDFGIYTIAGDVMIIIEEDMVYSLEDALKQGAITVQDMLDQIKQDEKYGFCEIGYYNDGGSTEYLYADYTILKFDTLDGNKDLVIGMQGQIMQHVNKSDYRTKFERN